MVPLDKISWWENTNIPKPTEEATFYPDGTDTALGYSGYGISPSLLVKNTQLPPDTSSSLNSLQLSRSTDKSIDMAMAMGYSAPNVPPQSERVRPRIVHTSLLRPDEVADGLINFFVNDLLVNAPDIMGSGDRHIVKEEDLDSWTGVVASESLRREKHRTDSSFYQNRVTEDLISDSKDVKGAMLVEEVMFSSRASGTHPSYRKKQLNTCGGMGKSEKLEDIPVIPPVFETWASISKYQTYSSDGGDGCTPFEQDFEGENPPCTNEWLEGSLLGENSYKMGLQSTQITRTCGINSTKLKTSFKISGILEKTKASLGKSTREDFPGTLKWLGRMSKSFKSSERRPLNSAHGSHYVRAIRIVREPGSLYRVPFVTLLDKGTYEHFSLAECNLSDDKNDDEENVLEANDDGEDETISIGFRQDISRVEQNKALASSMKQATAHDASLSNYKSRKKQSTRGPAYFWKSTFEQEPPSHTPRLDSSKISLGEEILDWKGYEGATVYYDEFGRKEVWYLLDPI